MATVNVLAQSIVATVGEDLVLQFTLTPVPGGGIAGRTYALTVKASSNAKASDPALLGPLAATIIDPVNAIMTVPVSQAQTVTLASGEFAWWLWRTDTGQATMAAKGLMALVRGGVFGA